jgi:uncharacterized metal-binding protein YceD (DUF177 family)
LRVKSEFIIKFSGLKAGIHQYNFNIDDKFFDLFEYSEIKSGDVKVDVSMEKTEDYLTMNFEIRGVVKAECDRCLELFDLPIEGKEIIFVRFGDVNTEGAENEIFISESETQFDIKHLIYENIILLLPYRRVHPDDEKGNSLCNKEVLKKLKLMEANKSADSPWEKLNDVKFKN